jgi:hypothetical protein
MGCVLSVENRCFQVTTVSLKSDPPEADQYRRCASALAIAAYITTPHTSGPASLDFELFANPSETGLFRVHQVMQHDRKGMRRFLQTADNTPVP